MAFLGKSKTTNKAAVFAVAFGASALLQAETAQANILLELVTKAFGSQLPARVTTGIKATCAKRPMLCGGTGAGSGKLLYNSTECRAWVKNNQNACKADLDIHSNPKIFDQLEPPPPGMEASPKYKVWQRLEEVIRIHAAALDEGKVRANTKKEHASQAQQGFDDQAGELVSQALNTTVMCDIAIQEVLRECVAELYVLQAKAIKASEARNGGQAAPAPAQ
jgi:hypothetical protein